MRYFAVFTTKNSLYTVERVPSQSGSIAQDARIKCVIGTFEGEEWRLSAAQWQAAQIEVGQQAHWAGINHTSTVQDFEEFHVLTLEQRAMRAGQGARNFVHAVVDHVDAQLNPRVMYVDD